MSTTRSGHARPAAHVFVVIAALAIATPSAGGTLIDDDLASIKQVRLQVDTGLLEYDPLPGPDASEFGAILEKYALEILETCGIASDPTADAVLYVNVSKFDVGELTDLVGVAVELELIESAELARKRGEDKPLALDRVVTWAKWDAWIVKVDEAYQSLLEETVSLTSEFAHVGLSARLALGISDDLGIREEDEKLWKACSELPAPSEVMNLRSRGDR